jgi:hypothetical protein
VFCFHAGRIDARIHESDRLANKYFSVSESGNASTISVERFNTLNMKMPSRPQGHLLMLESSHANRGILIVT